MKRSEQRGVDPRLLELKQIFLSDNKCYASELDGRDPKRPDRSRLLGYRSSLPKEYRPPTEELSLAATRTDWGESTWNSTHNWAHGIPEGKAGGIGRHSPRAMGAAHAPPLHPTLAAVAHATGRVMLPRVNDRQRRMWPEHDATKRSSELGLSLDPNDPRDSISRKMARQGKLRSLSETLPSEIRGSTLYTIN